MSEHIFKPNDLVRDRLRGEVGRFHGYDGADRALAWVVFAPEPHEQQVPVERLELLGGPR